MPLPAPSYPDHLLQSTDHLEEIPRRSSEYTHSRKRPRFRSEEIDRDTEVITGPVKKAMRPMQPPTIKAMAVTAVPTEDEWQGAAENAKSSIKNLKPSVPPVHAEEHTLYGSSMEPASGTCMSKSDVRTNSPDPSGSNNGRDFFPSEFGSVNFPKRNQKASHISFLDSPFTPGPAVPPSPPSSNASETSLPSLKSSPAPSHHVILDLISEQSLPAAASKNTRKRPTVGMLQKDGKIFAVKEHDIHIVDSDIAKEVDVSEDEQQMDIKDAKSTVTDCILTEPPVNSPPIPAHTLGNAAFKQVTDNATEVVASPEDLVERRRGDLSGKLEVMQETFIKQKIVEKPENTDVETRYGHSTNVEPAASAMATKISVSLNDPTEQMSGEKLKSNIVKDKEFSKSAPPPNLLKMAKVPQHFVPKLPSTCTSSEVHRVSQITSTSSKSVRHISQQSSHEIHAPLSLGCNSVNSQSRNPLKRTIPEIREKVDEKRVRFTLTRDEPYVYLLFRSSMHPQHRTSDHSKIKVSFLTFNIRWFKIFDSCLRTFLLSSIFKGFLKVYKNWTISL